MELRNRERKVDLNKLSTNEVDNLSVQVGDRIREICDEAAAKVNAILNIYGASAKISIQFDELSNKSKNKVKLPQARHRKRKQDNLK